MPPAPTYDPLAAAPLTLILIQISDEIIVPWHTGDYDLDQIYPNANACPRLDTLEDSIFATSGYQTENTSTSINLLTSTLDSIWGEGYWSWYNALDCMMTTVCTGRQLPDGTSSALMNETIFNATIAQVMYSEAYLNLYNDSQWAKLAMGNTAWHVRSNMENVMYNTSNSLNSSLPLKLAVFAGHDTTIIPFLASVLGDTWDKQWSGYASLVTIELYEGTAASGVDWYFRMIYNSEALLVPGCTDTLCDATVLLDKLSYGEESMPCSVSPDSDTTVDSCSDGDSDRLSNSDVILVAFMCALFGGLLGAGAVVLADKHKAKGMAAQGDNQSMTRAASPIFQPSNSINGGNV